MRGRARDRTSDPVLTSGRVAPRTATARDIIAVHMCCSPPPAAVRLCVDSLWTVSASPKY